MSLTSHIEDPRSPVRTFFAERLPHTPAVVRAAAPVIRGGRVHAPLAGSADVNAGRAGTAVDYLFRFALAEHPCPRRSSAHAGAQMLGRRVSGSAMRAVDEALASVANIAAYRRTATDDQWLELTKISLVLATFEAVYRSSGLTPSFLADLAEPPRDWRAWADEICVESEVEDVAVLGWAAAEDHRALRGRALLCNPIFTQSHALGGADADVITDDGVLVDLKSTSTTRVCSRSDLWQLCGYALADTDDELGITAVSLSVLRWRAQITWPLDSLLDQLAGQTIDAATLRQDFADLLARAQLHNRRVHRGAPRSTEPPLTLTPAPCSANRLAPPPTRPARHVRQKPGEPRR